MLLDIESVVVRESVNLGPKAVLTESVVARVSDSDLADVEALDMLSAAVIESDILGPKVVARVSAAVKESEIDLVDEVVLFTESATE